MLYYELPKNYLSEVQVKKGGGSWVPGFWATRLVQGIAGSLHVTWPPRKEGSAGMWKALTYFVTLPGMGVSMLNVFLKSHHGE